MASNVEGNSGAGKYSTELVWPDKKTEVDRIVLPFQTVETINKPRVKQEQLLTKFPENYPKDWKNMLIWGDNKYVMSSLLPKFAGKINLIYIDPPFATGADFSLNIAIGDISWVKEPNVLEEKAYRDTWGRGISSYLQMIYERLVLMQELLTEKGTIWVHLDDHVGHYVKVMLDEIFGRDNFINEIIWYYPDNFQGNVNRYANNHNFILVYGNSPEIKLNRVKIPLEHPIRRDVRVWDKKLGKVVAARDKNGKIIYKTFTEKYADDVWTIGQSSVSKVRSKEYLGYPTQKPEEILNRIIPSASKEGDIVADFFCGSGTTLAIAEKLGRRWIGSDLSKFAIHVTRKRLLDIDFCRPFDVLNLGSYQKYKFIENKHPPVARYLKFVLDLYRAQKLDGYAFIHGRKDGRLVHIAGVDSIVTEREIRDAAEECANALNGKAMDVLGWDIEMGLDELVGRIGHEYGIHIRLLQIPKEAMEVRSPAKEEVRFFDMNYLEVGEKAHDNALEIELKEFIIANQEYIPEEVKTKIRKFTDFIDYWAVDFNYQNDTFHNMWQSFRTKKHPKLEKKCKKTYDNSGRYTVLVKVIDIFGNDTNKLIRVEV